MTCSLCRLYLRPTSHLDSLIAGDVANQMVKEGKLHKDLLNLDAMEIAHEMTRKVCACMCACVDGCYECIQYILHAAHVWCAAVSLSCPTPSSHSNQKYTKALIQLSLSTTFTS